MNRIDARLGGLATIAFVAVAWAAVPRGRLDVFEGGDHSLHFSEPERLAKEINDFLAAM